MTLRPFVHGMPKPSTRYSGTTGANGQFSVTYPAAKSVTPWVIPILIGAPVTHTIRLVSSSATGFVVQVDQRTSTSVLGIDALSASATPVNGQAVTVLVVES